MAEEITFRPHHFMCTLGFHGKGYSTDFVRNYKKIVAQITKDENTQIKVAEYMDNICSACPNKIDEVICKTQNKVLKLDENHSKVLKLKPGQTLTWSQAKALIKKHMTIKKFHQACKGCSWKQYGVCEKALKGLLAT
ncbi:MAG: DUF1284 domain-containing protein [Rickettsiaceae bacterium]